MFDALAVDCNRCTHVKCSFRAQLVPKVRNTARFRHRLVKISVKSLELMNRRTKYMMKVFLTKNLEHLCVPSWYKICYPVMLRPSKLLRKEFLPDPFQQPSSTQLVDLAAGENP